MDNNEKTIQTIATIVTDIQYIKSDISDIKATLSVLLDHYVKRDEVESRFVRLQTELDKRFDGAHKRIDSVADEYVSNKEWDIYRTALRAAGGVIIMSVITSILYLVLKQ